MPVLLLPVALALGLLCGCERSQSAATDATAPQPALPTVNIQTVPAHKGEITRSITLPTFKLLPWQEATLYAKVAGYLKTLNVDIGDTVTQGQSLAEIVVPEMLAERPKYEAEVEAANADYQRVKEARQKAPDLVTPQTVDNAKAKYDAAKANSKRCSAMQKSSRPFPAL